MKMSRRIKRNMQPDRPMTPISLRLPDHVIDDLKEVAPSIGFGGHQSLIRANISNGLRQHPAELEAQRATDNTVEELSRRLVSRGIPTQAIQEAAAEMRSIIQTAATSPSIYGGSKWKTPGEEAVIGKTSRIVEEVLVGRETPHDDNIRARPKLRKYSHPFAPQ